MSTQISNLKTAYKMNHDSIRINIGSCQKFDKDRFNKGGPFWRKAYKYPNEGDIIKSVNGELFIAISVGKFTFNMIKYYT